MAKEKIKSDIKKFCEMNENEDTKDHNLKDARTVALRGKSVTIKAYY